MRRALGILFTLAALSAAAGATPAIAQQPREATELDLRDEVLASIQSGTVPMHCAIGPHNRQVACSTYRLSDAAGRAPDMRDWWRQVTGAQQQFVVVGKSRMGPYDGTLKDFPVFSPDGERVAFGARRGKSWFFVVDGEQGKTADSVNAFPAAFFSPDGKRTAYVAFYGDQVTIILDGIEGKRYDGISNLVFSPDGKRFACSVHSAGKAFVIVDGEELNPYDNIRNHSLLFSPDSKQVAYAAQRDNKWFVVVNGKEEGHEYDMIGWGESGLVFSPDGSRLAYAARRGKEWFIVVDGREGSPYSSVGDPVFSPDGRRLAHAVGSGKFGDTIVVDGVPGPKYKKVGGLIFSPDGEHVAYWAKRRKNKHIVVLDGVEGKVYEDLGFAIFGPDGKRLAYQAHDGKRAFIVVDGVEAGEYDFFITAGRPVFEGPGTLSAVFVRDHSFVRVAVEITRPERDP